jgi:hypothetical protein
MNNTTILFGLIPPQVAGNVADAHSNARRILSRDYGNRRFVDAG